ncbi:hypothetical protein G6O67_006541 [Ophiocordyceps sinensis]|uniref:Uncharacterized protein n=2 Tax=Ophiocordyceps sinensis TaxID=72228 RepID=A0A8H4PMV6_9HYPO|nr:hypothetical protein OCS_04942 [Ophiocordyceps sinensis CO18]KAF4506456.1 hypothetical protein G6O67_006541 [Ophiocordyceps sinensis]
MKPSALLTTTALAHALPSPTAAPVTLARPLNWLAGHALFPGQLLEGFGEPYENYTMQTWALHVLGKCREKTECNSTVSFAVLDEGGRAVKWVGYAFWGPHTTQNDYNRSARVQESVAYNVVRLPGA